MTKSKTEQKPKFSDVIAEIRRNVGKGKRISFVSGNFNVIHPGHLRIFSFAAEISDFLIVGVNPDDTPGVSVELNMRLEAIKMISFIDHVLPIEIPLDELLQELKPDIVVKGKEYAERYNIEQNTVTNYGGQLIFSSGEMRFASLNLINRDYSKAGVPTINKSVDFPGRHDFDMATLGNTLKKFQKLNVLVIGELIIDKYIECDPLGMSQEDPTIVVAPIEEKTFVGGAGIVAAHVGGLGAKVRYISVVGDDEPVVFAKKRFEEYGVAADLITDSTRPTILKQRYRAHGKTLLRVNHIRGHAISGELIDGIYEKVFEQLDTTDLILFSDFNYGCLPQPLIERISAEARRRGIMMAADSQASSQMSDIARFKHMNLITPTEREARMALRDQQAGLVVIGETLAKVAKAENVVVTLGAEGLLAYGEMGERHSVDRLPAFNTAPKDVAGGGDSFFATTALAMCAGETIWAAMYLGSIAAACQVSRLGNLPLSQADLLYEIEHSSEHDMMA